MTLTLFMERKISAVRGRHVLRYNCVIAVKKKIQLQTFARDY